MVSPVGQTTNIIQSQNLNSASEAAAAIPIMGSRSLALALGPNQAIPSASLTPISNNVATQSFNFLELPAEFKAHVLSFLPAQEIASTCRAVCPELRDFINRNESHIARLNIMHTHADLQYRINNLTQMKPHDFDSFVSCIRYWVAQRGFARYVKKSAYKPLDDWIILVSGDQDGQQRRTRYRWRSLNRRLVLLQQDIICNPATNHASILHQAKQRAKQDEVDYAQYTVLCELVAQQALSQPFFNYKDFEWNKRDLHETYPTFRLSRVSLGTGRDSYVLDPSCPLDSVAQLALPPLPAASFCYYVEEEWCREALDTGGVLSPLRKAALLEKVKIF
jgi:hypothetical protein